MKEISEKAKMAIKNAKKNYKKTMGKETKGKAQVEHATSKDVGTRSEKAAYRKRKEKESKSRSEKYGFLD